MSKDKTKDLLNFAHFVAKEIFQDDDYWELNHEAFPELACRKLYKLGIVEKNNGVWHYNPLELNDNESCSRAEYVGKWIPLDSSIMGDCCYSCSECGFIRDAYLLDEGRFCPRCGTKMNEGKNE